MSYKMKELDEVMKKDNRTTILLDIIPWELRVQLWPNGGLSWHERWYEVLMVAGEEVAKYE